MIKIQIQGGCGGTVFYGMRCGIFMFLDAIDMTIDIRGFLHGSVS